MPHSFWDHFGEALLMAAGMFWDVGWSLVLGFTISAVIQAAVSTEQMRRALGRDGVREIALATVAGAVSSSCSYGSAAISRTLFKKGAAFVPTLAFLFASTNLVIELGIILYLLMGWQFTAAEWIGGVVLIVIMSALVHLTYRAKLVQEARRHPEPSGGHDHESITLAGATLSQKLRDPRVRIVIAQNFAMDWATQWKDLVGGFLIAGALSAFVSAEYWAALFLKGSSPWLQVPVNTLVGPLIAVISFVCSIGNVPMAAVLWASGISFGGVLAFLYADLIVIPLLDVYHATMAGAWRLRSRSSFTSPWCWRRSSWMSALPLRAWCRRPARISALKLRRSASTIPSGSISLSARSPLISSGLTGNSPWITGIITECLIPMITGLVIIANGGRSRMQQSVIAHESLRTTKLYDRTKKRLTYDEVDASDVKSFCISASNHS